MIFDRHAFPSAGLLVGSLMYRLRSDSLLRNSIYIMSSTAATAVIGYLYWVIATHIYPARDVGLASALIGVMTLTSTLADLGISSTLVQILPHHKADFVWSLTLNAGLATGTLASLLVGGIVAIALPLFSYQFAILEPYAAYALVFFVGVPLGTIVTLLDQTFVAELVARNMLVRNVAFAVLKLPLMVLLVQAGTLGIFSSLVLALAATVIGGWLLLVSSLGRTYYLATRGIVRQVRTMLSSLTGHHFINIGGKASLYLLPMLVTVRLSAADNAYFYTTSMVGSFFFMVSSAVAVSLFAEGSHVENDLWRKAGLSAVMIGALLGPAMLTSFLGGPYILLLFGPSYVQHALQLLTILTIAAVPDAITNIYVSVLRVQRRLRHAALLNLGMAALTLALAWVLLPILGIAGAGWAFLIAQAAGSLIAVTEIIFTRYLRYWNSEPTLKIPSVPADQQQTIDESNVKVASVLMEMKDNHVAKKVASHKSPKKVVLHKFF